MADIKETKFGIIKSYLKEWDNCKLINAWRIRCEGYNDYDSEIYDMDSFEEYAEMWVEDKDHCGIGWLLDRVKYGNFNMSDDYWAFNGYGNLVSFNHLEEDADSPFTYDAVVEYLIDNGDEGEGLFDDDMDGIIDEFIQYQFPLTPDEARKVIEENDYDFITDDWEYITQLIREEIENNKEEE